MFLNLNKCLGSLSFDKSDIHAVWIESSSSLGQSKQETETTH